jgi:hypothetical protein
MKLPFFAVLVVSVMVISACRKRPAPAPVESSAKGETSSAPASAAAPSADGIAFAPEVVAAAMKPFEKDLDSKSSSDHLRVMNEALSFWQASGRPFPKDLNDLVASKLLKRLPTPPAGKQFVLDRAGNRIVLTP